MQAGDNQLSLRRLFEEAIRIQIDEINTVWVYYLSAYECLLVVVHVLEQHFPVDIDAIPVDTQILLPHKVHDVANVHALGPFE